LEDSKSNKKMGYITVPLKKNQKDNPGAVCGICIAEHDQDV
jgi:uncharacterized protein (UPF0305 family)